MKRGDDFIEISDDLTKGSKKGNVPFGTLTSISESSFQFGLLYVGSDDGLVHVTKNGGDTWTNISPGLPQNLWISRVIASQHKKERVYVTLNGYRNDDFNAYVYLSDDYGRSWTNINGNLPESPVNVIKEDPTDENIIYLGNDQGVHISFNKGESWDILENALPRVAVHDLVVQDQAKELIIGTHGRSIYKTNISSMQQYQKVKNKDLVIFDLEDIKHSSNWGNSWSNWSDPKVPEYEIPFYTSKSGEKTIQIKTKDDILLNTLKIDATKGFNFKAYDLSFSDIGLKSYQKKNKDIKIEKKKNGKYYLPKGKYMVFMNSVSKEFKIK